MTAPRTREPRPGIVLHRSRVLAPEDRAVVAGIPVTSVARTLVDLADVVAQARLDRAVREAELLRLLDMRAVARAVDGAPNRRGRGRLVRALAAYRPEAAVTRSEGERRLLAAVRAQGLPVPSANPWVECGEVDLYWPDALLAVEYDGEAVHRTTHAFHEDRRRDRIMAAKGVQVVRVTARDLEDPAALASELAEIRARRLGGA